ncbi:Glutathione S-transferase Z2 [Capsicum annuum]|nr:Glutathione S-transferase Z2 [Capsicum annuum]KAF3677537.1 Glutathione S-transferase Z2 [Capsicum annuum]
MDGICNMNLTYESSIATRRGIYGEKLQLYSSWLSSCAFRVRIALNLKGLDYEYKAVNLLEGEHTKPALEKLLKDYDGKYATGDEVYMADLFLAPQIHGAIKRFEIDMNEFPTLLRVFEAYQELPALQDAMPEKQPDATI